MCFRLGETVSTFKHLLLLKLRHQRHGDTSCPAFPICFRFVHSFADIKLLAYHTISSSNERILWLVKIKSHATYSDYTEINLHKSCFKEKISHVWKDIRAWPSEGWAGVSKGTRLHGLDIPVGASWGDSHASNPPTSSQSHPFHVSSSDWSVLLSFVRYSSNRSHRRTAARAQSLECSKTHRYPFRSGPLSGFWIS